MGVISHNNKIIIAPNGKALIPPASGVERATWHQCPEAVRDFLTNVTYNPADYSTSQIDTYAPATAVASNTKPIGKTIDSVTYYNNIPNVDTPFSSTNTAGTVKPLDRLRWINTVSTPNVRDLGGWTCDGGKIKYGRMFRGGIPNATDRDVLVNQCGVTAEIDLRGRNDAGNVTTSPLGNDIKYFIFDRYAWYSIDDNALWKQLIRTAFDLIAKGENIYFNCAAGADRTGTFACIIEAILGVSQSDIDKDYELTSFYTGTASADLARRRNEDEWKGLIAAITAKSGNTFSEKVINWVATLGFTAAEINAFRNAMIDGTPEEITLDLDTYTITNTVSHVTTDNDAESIDQYQPYTANISPENGYVISDVSVKMDGQDITAQVWRGTETNLYVSVSSTLTNCTADNSAKKVIAGQSYAANITASDGYTLDGASITITMGGVNMAQYYSNGKIAIPNVTGDIVINITAISSTPSYTNLFNASDSQDNHRYNSSGVAVESTGAIATNVFFTGGSGHVLRVKGIDPTVTSVNRYVWCSDASGSVGGTGVSTPAWVSEGNGVYSYTLAFPETYAKISFEKSGAVSDIVITIDEPIT